MLCMSYLLRELEQFWRFLPFPLRNAQLLLPLVLRGPMPFRCGTETMCLPGSPEAKNSVIVSFNDGIIFLAHHTVTCLPAFPSLRPFCTSTVPISSAGPRYLPSFCVSSSSLTKSGAPLCQSTRPHECQWRLCRGLRRLPGHPLALRQLLSGRTCGTW